MNAQKIHRFKRAFTLIELIIVVAIIAILAAAIFVALDPARRLNESRNARRWSDVTTMLEAVKKHQVDNEGTLLAGISALTEGEYAMVGTDTDQRTCRFAATPYFTASALCTAAPAAGAAADDCVDLSLMGTGYIGNVPADPRVGTDAQTRYYVKRDANGAITVGACDAEGEGAGGSGTAPTVELVR